MRVFKMLIDDRRICMRWQTTNEMGRLESCTKLSLLWPKNKL